MDKEKAIEILQIIRKECMQIEKSCKECTFYKILKEEVFCPFGFTPEKWEL